jgi:hypothetical protein
MRKIKRGGLSKLPEGIATATSVLLKDLGKIGLFLVPVGELEQWLAAENLQASKDNKWAWANEAATCIQESGNRKGDVWDFMRDVAQYLTLRLN